MYSGQYRFRAQMTLLTGLFFPRYHDDHEVYIHIKSIFVNFPILTNKNTESSLQFQHLLLISESYIQIYAAILLLNTDKNVKMNFSNI